jgi:sulfoxide reductase catalytic subunit YedY
VYGTCKITQFIILFLFLALIVFPFDIYSDDQAPGESDESVRKATALLHVTGTPQEVTIRRWRLKINGDKAGKTLRISYPKLLAMETVARNVALVCPGAFSDRADWEGVPLKHLMEMAKVDGSYERVMVVGLDGFTGIFTREEVENHLIFLATKVNGVTLPAEHGNPVRIVAEDILGGRWIKWIDYIQID